VSIYSLPPSIKRALTAGFSIAVLGLSLSSNSHTNNANYEIAHTIFLGDIITVNDAQPSAQALAVKDGKIIAVGDEQSVLNHKGPDTQLQSLNGHTIMPGFIDSHTHPILASMMAETIDISGFNHHSPEDVMTSLKQGIESKSDGEWVIAYGWDPSIIPTLEAPTLKQLDTLSPDKPLFIISQTLHSAFANSLALKAAGIDKNTPNPQGGSFAKDKNGELTGLIIEVGAMAKFTKVTPKFPLSAYLFLLTKQMQRYAQAGYTTIVAPGLQPIIPDHINSLKQVAEHSDSPVRVFTYPLYKELKKSAIQPENGNEFFKVLGPKFWVDGSPYAGGMAMQEPYLNNAFTQDKLGIHAGEKGHLTFTQNQLNELVLQHHADGWQIAAHIQGERAADQFFNAVSHAQQHHSNKNMRHRMEHNALVTQQQFKTANHLGLTPSFYIDHIFYYGDALHDNIVGPERAKRFMAVQSAIEAGHTVSLHTDTPSSPIGPIRAMQGAVLRSTRSNQHILGKNEQISVIDAIKTMTINGAWQISQEHNRGSIEVGKMADFTVLSHNLTKLPITQWQDVKVIETYLAGNKTNSDGWSWRKTQLVAQTLWHMLLD
jgi:predicted amidohydrolase YtcJ